jgi:hypothetical protein
MTNLRPSFFRSSRALTIGVAALSTLSTPALAQAPTSDSTGAPAHETSTEPASNPTGVQPHPAAPAAGAATSASAKAAGTASAGTAATGQAPAETLSDPTGVPPAQAPAVAGSATADASPPPPGMSAEASVSAAPAAAPAASAAPSSPPDEPSDGPSAGGGGPFAAGRSRLTLLVGSGSTGEDTYLILGAGIGHYIAKGLEVGIDYEAWLFGSPVLQRVSPEARYILAFVPKVQPYVGIFYRHTFVSDFADMDSVGARGGLYFAPKGPLSIGAGAVYERQLNCDESILNCDSVYPELTLAFSF